MKEHIFSPIRILSLLQRGVTSTGNNAPAHSSANVKSPLSVSANHVSLWAGSTRNIPLEKYILTGSVWHEDRGNCQSETSIDSRRRKLYKNVNKGRICQMPNLILGIVAAVHFQTETTASFCTGQQAPASQLAYSRFQDTSLHLKYKTECCFSHESSRVLTCERL